jgi:hypothetical protein
MRNGLLAALLAALVVPQARAAGDGAASLEDGCVNEIGVLCRGRAGGRLLACLDENRDAALPGCRASIDAEHERLDRERDAREAARQEERLRAELGEELDARVASVSGGVYLRTASMPDGRFVRIEAGTPLSTGDLLRTGADGSADVVWEGRSLAALSPNTDLAVDALSPDEVELAVGLGRVTAKLAKTAAGREERLVTPLASASVKGTELVVEQAEGKPAAVAVLDEGHVGVSALSGGPEVALGPNQETQVGPGGPPQAAKPLAQLASAKAAIAGIRQRLAAAQKQWKPLDGKQRVAARLQLAKTGLVPAAKLPGLSPAQLKRDYAELKQRQAELLRRRAGKR